ncbi:S-protein homolog 29-like [Lotus japonicus]|uniref:S-protein homolog 29-like n=1 Tax=Lotus japonicus TaxID=34305 RepID=UPI002582D600|nr:S-protein homolog 29-like [Lotus japonicus]
MLKVLGIILSVLVIIATDVLIAPVQGFDNPAERSVRVINNFTDNSYTQLYVHCHSKDDDLGEHYLSKGQYTEWFFADNIWGTTLFWCHFAWNNVQKSFRVYSTKHDDERGYYCYLAIKEDGAYFYDGFQYWNKMIPW